MSTEYHTKWPGFLDSYYGTEWRIHPFQECEGAPIDTLYHQVGMVNNYRSEMAFNYEDKIAICVMFNSYSSFSKNVVPRILEIIRNTQALVHTKDALSLQLSICHLFKTRIK